MRNLNILLCGAFVFFTSLMFSQSLKAVYEYIPSQYMTFNENVYYTDGNQISIRDSISTKRKIEKNDDEFSNEIVIMDNKSKVFKRIIIKKPNSKMIEETGTLNDKNYLLEDNFPELHWNLNYTEVEKIGNYMCNKATASYRGTTLIAFYTKEIPVPAGPYKFGGLPGLIVMLYNDSLAPNYWTLTNVEYPYNDKIPYSKSYLEKLPKMSLQAFIKEGDRIEEEEMKVFNSKLPPDIVIESSERTRGTVEQVYEWEKSTKK